MTQPAAHVKGGFLLVIIYVSLDFSHFICFWIKAIDADVITGIWGEKKGREVRKCRGDADGIWRGGGAERMLRCHV